MDEHGQMSNEKGDRGSIRLGSGRHWAAISAARAQPGGRNPGIKRSTHAGGCGVAHRHPRAGV